ncbi:peptidylprolyl isomerase [Okeania sp. SIO2G5]|uniref:peptidylprolyl isomerase n=1 Tax=Okeania sp. SIO2G5 TaxID=2607796 RepID=UPI00338D61E5
MAGYQMLPKFLQELIIDEAIAGVECTPEEQADACQQFYAQQQITDDAARQEWLKQYGMTQEQLEKLAARGLRIEKYKQDTWGIKLESYFLERKGSLDKVIYSLIRTKDVGVAQEVYFRINDGEQSFAELAREYSQGPEAQTDGLIGPVELNVPHPALANLLSRSQPGELSPPTRVGEWMVIVRLERFIPCQMDDAMRRRLLDEQFNVWLREKMQAIDAVFAHANSEGSSALPEAEIPTPPEKDDHAAEATTETAPTQGNVASPSSESNNLQDPWSESAASSTATGSSPT